jgi:hypothetical protein
MHHPAPGGRPITVMSEIALADLPDEVRALAREGVHSVGCLGPVAV